jgi:hypothetical protein
MANPNIVNVTTIYGNTGTLLATTTMANVVQNPASSGAIYKINNLIVTNACTAAVAVNLQINQAGSSSYVAANVSIPAAAVVVLLAKDSGLYLLENCSLQVNATSNSYITAVSSWEQIS